MLFPKAKKKYSEHKKESVISLLQSKLEIIKFSIFTTAEQKDKHGPNVSFKYSNMISLPACSYVVLIFIHILDYSVSHYFNKTLFLHRQALAPCEAEVTVSGFQHAQSNPNNYWLGVTFQTTGHVFVGGLPLTYSSYKVRLCIVGLFVLGVFVLIHDRLKFFMP